MTFDKSFILDVTEVGKVLKISTLPKLDLETNIVSVSITFLSTKDIKNLFSVDTTSTQLIRQSSQVDKTYFVINSELPIGKCKLSLLINNDKGVEKFIVDLVDKL